ncbi:MAG: chemotaxis protein CheX [Rhizobacter sp.]|nr:chemotaxis protein CheX [Bacteriovorax sp.]
MTGDPSNFIDFSRPFVDACKNIFTTMVGSPIEAQKPQIKSDSNSRGDITAVIGLSGELDKGGVKTPYRAMLVVAFPYDTYFKVASAMLSETYTTYHPDIHDLGGEIVNMIMGNAKRDLKTLGYTSNMAIPSLIEGKNHSIKYPTGTTVVLIPFTSQFGPLYMELCYSINE